MPIPTPRTNESQDDFHSRCMGDATMLRDYTDVDQRNAICYRAWDRAHPENPHQRRGTSPRPQIWAFTHTSTIADQEPDWSSIDKTKLPRVAFADQGEPESKSTWGYPHHWVENGGNEDENGIYTTGTMYLHTGGWQAAWNAAHGARSGQRAAPAVIAHLESHRTAIEDHRQADARAAMRRGLVLLDTPECFRAHLGLWAIEPRWIQDALLALQRGLWPLRSQEELHAETHRPAGSSYARTEDGVAVIRLVGQISKGPSKFGGTSTVFTRRALRQAAADEAVVSIVLAIDSPGGQVDGIQDLADEVQRTRQHKIVDAYIEDLGASAAYWIASQARRISANSTAFIGSIGAFAVLEDVSGQAEREGISVRVVSTGPYKGTGIPGIPVTQDMLDEVQKQVDHIGAFFFAAVRKGRRMTRAQLERVSDGRVWIAAEAEQLGLIDVVQTFDDALAMAREKRLASHTAARMELARLRILLT